MIEKKCENCGHHEVCKGWRKFAASIAAYFGSSSSGKLVACESFDPFYWQFDEPPKEDEQTFLILILEKTAYAVHAHWSEGYGLFYDEKNDMPIEDKIIAWAYSPDLPDLEALKARMQ